MITCKKVSVNRIGEHFELLLVMADGSELSILMESFSFYELVLQADGVLNG